MRQALHHTVRAVCGVAAAGMLTVATAGSLPRFNADPAQVTVSGVSSGGAMAVQAHVAYSGTFRGAAVFAGVAYYCAQGNTALAIARCQEPLSALEIPVAQLVATTREWSSQGLIDNTANLAASKVYMFSGTLDQTVRQPSMDALRDYYLNFLPASNLVYNNQTAAGHGWVSPLGKVLCAAQQSPFINDCFIDPQQTFLSMFYGPLQARQAGALTGTFIPVDQGEFIDDRNPNLHGLDNNAFLYVPASCARGETCKVHVAYHGCNMSYAKIGDQFVRGAGINEWADTNRMLVLYPQILASTMPVNGLGCWDWFGYDSADYAKKNGPQMLMTKRMVDRMTSAYAPVEAPTNLAVSKILPRSLTLTWNGVNGAVGYRIYRDGSAIGTTDANAPTITDKSIAPKATYTYTVRALAKTGNEGPASTALIVNTR